MKERAQKGMSEDMKMSMDKMKKEEIKSDCFREWGFADCFCVQATGEHHEKKSITEIMLEREKVIEGCRTVVAEYEKRIAAQKRR